MSAPEHVERARRWLEEQVELLGSLRNATPRDPSFKLWRQNTLTMLQRIWPGEQSHSERFRRISFSPASPKSDFRTTREWYVRGCAEAVEFLRSLLVEVDAAGVPEPGPAAPAPQLSAGAREDDFPVLELPSLDMSARSADAGDDFVLLDADGTAAVLAPQEGGSVTDDSGAPAPPTLRVEPRTAPAPSSVPDAAPPKLPARTRNSRPAPIASPESVPTLPKLPASPSIPASQAAPTPPPAPSGSEASRPPEAPRNPAPATAAGDRRASAADRRTPRAAKPRRGTAQPRLKDLLGLQNFGNFGAPEEPEGPVAPAPPTPVAAAPSPPVAPPAPPTPVAAAPVAPVAPSTPSAPIVPEVPPQADPPAEAEAEGVDFSQATADFMRNSPVLGLQGRPVQRVVDSIPFLEPDAVALAGLAIDIGKHVSDEAAREPLRLALFELAAQIEAHAPEWSSLRELVSAAMAHPELARRLIPLVLPWLGRAA